MSFIELKDINLSFNDKNILRNFSLSIRKGDKILISGKSGKGKSTILKIILGFITFESGQLLIDEKIISKNDFQDIRKKFAYVNQDVTLRPGKVSDVLEDVASFSGNTYSGSFDHKLASYFEFDLSLLDKDVDELSGGERQRLGIILSIMLDRDVYLLDEVTSALDKSLKEKVVNYFADLNATVIAISHDSSWSKNESFCEVIL